MDAMQCLGGNGYINGKQQGEWMRHRMTDPLVPDYPTGRILRDARLYTVGAGTQEIRRMLIGREFNEEFKRRAS